MAALPDLSALFNLPPERAAAFLREKGLRLTGPYWELDGPAHSRVFTVANLAKLDVLADIQAAVQGAIERGETERWFRAQLVDTLREKGWWGPAVQVDPVTLEARIIQQGSLRRLQTIYRTNLQSAYMAGRHRQAMEQIDRAPYAQYLAVRDSRTRPAHAALHGKVFRLDSPEWGMVSPPNGYNSLLPWQRVSGHTYVGLKAWYAGPAVELVGKSGGRLAVTAQHPVLTVNGWVAAGQLRQGDQLVGYRPDIGGGAVPTDLHEDDPPPTIEEVFEALRLGGRCAMPRAAVNLYGDAVFLQGDVDVVAADRKLLGHFEAARQQFVSEVGLHDPDQALAGLPGPGASREVRSVERHGVAGGLRPAAHRVGAEHLGDGRLPVDMDAGLAKLAANPLGASAQAGGDPLDPDPGQVPVDRLIWKSAFEVRHIPRAELDAGQFVGFRHGALGNAPLADVFVGGLDVNPHASRDILETQAGLVMLDEVVDVRRFEYAGHVYDLETAAGLIATYSGRSTPHIIVSNCRCRARYMSQRELDARGLAPAEDVRILERTPQRVPVDRLTGESPARIIERGVSVADGNAEGGRVTLWADRGWDHLPGSDGAERMLVDRLMEKAASLSDGIREVVLREIQTRAVAVAPLVVPPAQRRLSEYISEGAATVDELLARIGVAPGQALEDAQLTAFRAELLRVLQAERGMDRPARVKGAGAGAKTTRAASQLFPDVWTAAADKLGDLHARQSAKARGWAWTATADGRVRLPGFGIVDVKAGEGWIEVNGTAPNAVHEYAHRLQAALPDLDKLFQDLHRRRTTGEPLRRLRDLRPTHNYKPHEVTREDQYLNPYQGKEYGDRGALEVMPMAFQYVLGGRMDALSDTLTNDREMLNLVAGLLRYWAP